MTCNEQPKLSSPAEKLGEINGAFGLAVADYAKIYGIERQTYYNWKKNTDIKEAVKLDFIDELFDIASGVAVFNTHAYGRLAKTHTLNNESLLSLLMARPLNAAKILEHCEALTTMMDERQGMKVAKAHDRSIVHHTNIISDDGGE